MKEISGNGGVRKRRDRWQLYQKVLDRESGKRLERTMVTEIECFPDSTRGKRAAMALLPEFRMRIRDEVERENGIEESRKINGGDLIQGIRGYIDYKLASGIITEVTADGYSYSLKHIERGFQGMSPDELTPEDVVEWLNESFEKGHSRKVMRKAYVLLNSYYRHLLSYPEPSVKGNPLASVPQPRTDKPIPNPLKPELIERLNSTLQNITDNFLGRSCILALHLGLRAGECAALQWGDVDLERGRAHISKSIAVSKIKKEYVKSTKGRESRDCPCDPLLVTLLRSWYRSDLTFCRTAGISNAELFLASRPVISSYLLQPEGKFISPQSISKGFHALAEVAGLFGTSGKLITFHGLRHTFATQWVAAGGDIAALSRILGHKSSAFTMDVYVSSDPLAMLNGILNLSPTLSAGWVGAPQPFEYTSLMDSVGSVRIQIPAELWTRFASITGGNPQEIQASMISALEANRVA